MRSKPPPNHQATVCPSRTARKWRTLACVVGTCGLRGWKTSDTPTARQDAPASSGRAARSEEHTSELQSLMRIPYAVFCLKTKPTSLMSTYHPVIFLKTKHYTHKIHTT